MRKKLIILSLTLAMSFVISAPISSVNAGGKKNRINWRIAGTIVQFIDVTPPGSIDPEPKSLINLTAYGPPGLAKITLLSKTGEIPTAPDQDCIDKGYVDLAYNFVENDFIALFPDQSLLFASIHEDGGFLCFNFSRGESYFKVKMNITGGKGRFEGASGGFTATGNGYFINPFGTPPSDNTLVGENGRVKGWIDFD